MASSLSISDSHQLVVKHEPCTVWCLDLQLTAFIFHAFFFVYPLQVWDPISTNTPRYGSNWGTNPTGLLCTVNPSYYPNLHDVIYTHIHLYHPISVFHGETMSQPEKPKGFFSVKCHLPATPPWGDFDDVSGSLGEAARRLSYAQQKYP
jgi:hypothetical protein